MSATRLDGNRAVHDVGIIIVSDRAASGEREDTCIPVFRDHLNDDQFSLVHTAVVPDDIKAVQLVLREMIDKEYSLVFTAGGTGCSPRDRTPEATTPFLERRTPGIDEAIRSFSAQKSPHAAYSRGISGIGRKSLIINLPGSPKAVGEILSFLKPTLGHPLRLISGEKIDCATEL
ncbi:MAG: MogA/MoaB family molybdenum cofactor biosynthesis protein [candidate division Zixibacteria bacterium]|nr:MogA/MoaB family molybdenum cofactor biosynthesis protein [candidate division Zixibacteria bacterium]